MRLRCAVSFAVLMITSACAPLRTYESRPARSSLGCMQAARDKSQSQLHGQPDYVEHCMAAGTIARYCSVTEAGIASVGKEILDLFTGGDAEWSDLTSDRRGIRCARKSQTDLELSACCASLVGQDVAHR